VTVDGSNFLFTANTDVSWSADQQIAFEIGNVQSAGTANAGDVQRGAVILIAHPSSEKLPAEAQSQLSLAWEQFSASITWDASAGTATNHLTLTGDCANSQTSCSGGPVTAYSQNSYPVTSLVPATDSDGNAWELGYQFNYVSNGDGTYTTRLRAVVYDPTTSPATARYTGDWVPYGSADETPSTAKYMNTAGQTQITIYVTYPSS
jgi:hypothetical protein